jgi:Mg-chelatase subunit ChlD
MSDIVGNNYGQERGSPEPHNKSYFCQQAVNTFLDNCFAGATKVGIASFPELVVVEPTHALDAVRVAAQGIEPTGSTPMHEPLNFVLDEWPITHGIVVSDGSPDSHDDVLDSAKRYKAKGIKVDAVHIGQDHGGEELMKSLAEITGGIYIKFTDVKAFAESFKYLTPKHRLTLTTSKNPIALLGAADVKL